MKKILAILLTLTMIVGLAASAMAASISILHDGSFDEYGDPTSDPRVYLAYKIFDASYEELSGENTEDDFDDFTYTPDDAAVSYSMTADNPWVDVMLSADQVWFNVTEDANGNYVVVPIESAYEDAEDALAFAEYLAANIPDDATSTDVTVDAGEVDVDPGYYLIIAKDEQDSVTRVALVTTDVVMYEKNTYMNVHKETAQTSYSVGDIVEYTVTVGIPATTALTELDEEGGYKEGHGPIVLHDTMDSRLTFQGEITTDLDEDLYELIWTEDADAVNHTTAQDDGCTFEIVINVTEDLLGQTITFTYNAEVNSSAATDEGFVNELFGENNHYNTIPDEPLVYTFDFDFVKEFDGAEEGEEFTATFELRTDAEDEGTAISFITDEDGNYIKADSDDEGADTTITMTNGEQLNFLGFAAGTYYLVELTTDTGYNLLDGPVTVTITDTTQINEETGEIEGEISHTVTYVINDEESQEGVVTVVNYSGTVLPSTGGIGTTIFYVLGGLMAVGAGVVLVTKKRMGKVED